MKEATHEVDLLCARARELFLDKFTAAYTLHPKGCGILTRMHYARHALRQLPRLKELGWTIMDVLDDVRMKRLVEIAQSPQSKRDYWFPKGTSESDIMALVATHPAEHARRGRKTRHDHEPPHIRARLIQLDQNEYRKKWIKRKRMKQKTDLGNNSDD